MTLSILAFFATTTLADAQAPGTSQRFGETADVVLVQIPVYATHSGEPVRGLTKENFEILEGKKSQPVVGVDVFDLATLPSDDHGLAARAVPSAGRRNFVLLFDLSNSLPAGIVRAREAARDLARRGLHPSDLVAVATYSQSRGIELVMGFSTDRAQLDAALDDLGLSDPFDRPNDPLRLVLVDPGIGLEEKLAQAADEGRERAAWREEAAGGMQQAFADALKDLSTLDARVSRDQLKQQILDLSTHMEALGRLLDSTSGRKQVVLFSQGFDSEVVFGTRDMGRIQEIASNLDDGELWRVDSDERFGASDAQDSLLEMLEQYGRSDCAIHAVDVGGLVAGGEAAVQRVRGGDLDGSGRLDRGHDGLALMANETGGEFYRNFNDLTAAMDDLLERTSVIYVVSIAPKDVAMDGAYHPITVRLKGLAKDTAKGVELSHRPGYYARRPYWELEASERQLLTAERLVAGAAGGEIGAELLAAAFPRSEDTAYVLTALEVDGGSLIAAQPDNMVPTEIHTYAFDEEGRIRDFFSQAVELDLYKVGYRLDSGFKLLSHLELPPGRYEIRSMVRNARTGAAGLAVSQVTVPAFDGTEPFLLPPFFIEPDDHWLVGFEERSDRTAPYPLTANGKPMVPSSRPRLVAGQQIPMLLVAHELPESIEVAARLVGADGRYLERFAIEVERRIADRGEGERLVTKLTTGAVEPGDYRLVVTVRGDGREASSSVPVRILESG
jgi:VWFA-related protein